MDAVPVDAVAEQLRAALSGSVGAAGPCTIALSGGLDSSVIAALRSGDARTRCVSVVSSEFGAPDMVYGQEMARRAGLPLEIVNAGTAEILDAVERTIGALGNYNTIEIRNSAVICLAFEAACRGGAETVMTGDGADELFAGYSFLVGAPRGQLRARLERLQRIMHFPSERMAGAMGIAAALPYTDEAVAAISRSIPEEMLVRDEGGVRTGKWILRRAFEDIIPRKIAWRAKVPMSEGAGLDGLGGFLDRMIPDSVFAERARGVLERDDIRIRDKESLHYYEVYRRTHGAPERAPEGAQSCPDCHSDTGANDGRFCRMCGRYEPSGAS